MGLHHPTTSGIVSYRDREMTSHSEARQQRNTLVSLHGCCSQTGVSTTKTLHLLAFKSSKSITLSRILNYATHATLLSTSWCALPLERRLVRARDLKVA